MSFFPELSFETLFPDYANFENFGLLNDLPQNWWEDIDQVFNF